MPDLIFTSKGGAQAIAEQERLNAAAKQLSEEYKKSEGEAKDLERAAKRIYEQTRTPQEQMLGRIKKIEEAQKKGLIPPKEAEQAIERLKRKMDGLGDSTEEVKDETEETFGGTGLGKLTRYAAGLASLGAAIAAITNELRSQVAVGDRATQAKLSVAQSRNVVLRNLAGASDQDKKLVLAQNAKLAGKLGVSETTINLARAEGLSGSGGNIPASLSATEVGTQFLKDRPSEVPQFVGSLLDLSKVTGTDDAKVNLGLLTQVASLSRVVNPQQQAQNIPRALIGAKSFGTTAEGSAALFLAITTGSGDITGARSGTGTIQLAKQLFEFDLGLEESGKNQLAKQKDASKAKENIEKAKRTLSRARQSQTVDVETAQRSLDRILEDRALAEKEGPLSKKQRISFERRIFDARADIQSAGGNRVKEAEANLASAQDRLQSAQAALQIDEQGRSALLKNSQKFSGLNTSGRIAFLQNNPELARAFLGDASFEAVTLGPIRDLLLNPQSGIARQFSSNLNRIPGNAGLSRLADDTLASFGKFNKLEPVAEANRRVSSLAEILRINTPDRLTPENRENLQDVLQHVGRTNLGARASTLLGSLSDGDISLSVKETADILRNEAARLRAPKGTPTVGIGGPGEVLRSPASEEDIKNAQILEQVVEFLKQQVEQQKETNRKLADSGLVAGAE